MRPFFQSQGLFYVGDQQYELEFCRRQFFQNESRAEKTSFAGNTLGTSSLRGQDLHDKYPL